MFKQKVVLFLFVFFNQKTKIHTRSFSSSSFCCCWYFAFCLGRQLAALLGPCHGTAFPPTPLFNGPAFAALIPSLLIYLVSQVTASAPLWCPRLAAVQMWADKPHMNYIKRRRRKNKKKNKTNLLNRIKKAVKRRRPVLLLSHHSNRRTMGNCFHGWHVNRKTGEKREKSLPRFFQVHLFFCLMFFFS